MNARNSQLESPGLSSSKLWGLEPAISTCRRLPPSSCWVEGGHRGQGYFCLMQKWQEGFMSPVPSSWEQ